MNFTAIDFETANADRVSACQLGLVKVIDGQIVKEANLLIKPIGPYEWRNTDVHGLTDIDTRDSPRFDSIYQHIKDIFNYPIVAYSAFDKSVLNALNEHYDLGFEFDYFDCCKKAKELLPELRNHQLKTLARHYNLGSFRHHDGLEDARVCAQIYLRLHGVEENSQDAM